MTSYATRTKTTFWTLPRIHAPSTCNDASLGRPALIRLFSVLFLWFLFSVVSYMVLFVLRWKLRMLIREGKARGGRPAHTWDNDQSWHPYLHPRDGRATHLWQFSGNDGKEDMNQGSVWGGFPYFLGFFLAHCFEQGREARRRETLRSSFACVALLWHGMKSV